jgi:hypothetical protein
MEQHRNGQASAEVTWQLLHFQHLAADSMMILGRKKFGGWKQEFGGWKTNSKIAHSSLEHQGVKNRIVNYLIIWDLGCRFPQTDQKGQVYYHHGVPSQPSGDCKVRTLFSPSLRWSSMRFSPLDHVLMPSWSQCPPLHVRNGYRPIAQVGACG